MKLAGIALEQVIIMLIIIVLGFVLTKLKVISVDSKKSLSNILVYLVVPFMIINSYMSEYNKEILVNLGYTFLVSFIVLLLGVIISLVFTLLFKTDNRPIIRFAMMFSNAAYMGFPLIEAMFGSEGLIYASGFVSVFNIFLWTIGYMIVSKSVSFKTGTKAILKNPVLYSLIIGIIIFFFQIPIPKIIKTPISLIGAMNTPLSMLITGIIIASSNIFSTLKNKYLWLATLTRLIIIPFIALGSIAILGNFNIEANVLKIVFILASCPVAAITSVFAVKFNYSDDLAASMVVISTLLSIITLPVFTLLINYII